MMLPKSWRESKTIQYLFVTWFATTLLQLAPMLAARSIDWCTLGAQAVVALAGALVRMIQPDIDAPLEILNKANK